MICRSKCLNYEKDYHKVVFTIASTNQCYYDCKNQLDLIIINQQQIKLDVIYNKMFESESESNSSKTFINAFTNLRVSDDVYIEEISAYSNRCETPGLKQINARHCFVICKLSNQSKVLIERGAKQFTITQQIKNGSSFIGSSSCTNHLSWKDLYNKLTDWCKSKGYDVTNNNCYDFCAQICVFLDASNLKLKIDKAKTSIIMGSVIKGTQILATNCVQITQGALAIKNFLAIKKKALEFIKAAKVANIANQILKTQGIINSAAKIKNLGISNTIPVTGLVGQIVGEVISSGIDTYHEGWKTQTVVKGIKNVTKGTLGSYGGFVLGSELGATVGVIGGPVGIAFGGAIGGIIGSIGGCWGIKQI